MPYQGAPCQRNPPKRIPFQRNSTGSTLLQRPPDPQESPGKYTISCSSALGCPHQSAPKTYFSVMLKLKFQCFGHLMPRTDSLEKTLMLGKMEGRGRRGRQRMRWLDGVTDSMDVSLSSSGSW